MDFMKMDKICYIISAGDLPRVRIDKRREDLVIAADAGYLNLEALGLSADITVGDFDSLSFVPENCEVIRHPVRKDDTDTALAVKTGLERGFRLFVIVGGTGGRREDHTIANIQTLIMLAWTAISGRRMRFPGENSGTLSVFCFGGDAGGVNEKGLSYTLENAVMTASVPLGVSNSFTGVPAEVSVGSGTLVICWETDYQSFVRTVEYNEGS